MKNFNKRIYTPLRTTMIQIEQECPILAQSVIVHSAGILSVGQEKGESYDFSEPEFNQDWEAGAE